MSAVQTASADGLATATARAGTSEPFEQFYARLRDPLYAYVLGLLRDRDSAEEVTAQAFERAYRTWSRVDAARGSATTWLFGIARNAALDELRRIRRHAVPTEAEQIEVRAGGSGATDGATDERLVLQHALASLPTRDRELIALKYYAGLTNREIARVTRESESNVGTRLSRIIRQLRSTL
jgi:RNA polymerase sigma-70 factor (ECF subfamily)